MVVTKFETYKRVPYFPACVNSDGALTDSKFSGIPWLGNGEEWPKCKNCDKAMQLFVQLNLDTLPKDCKVKGLGLMQFFYCTNSEPHCEVDCGSWFPNDKAMLVRIVLPEGAANSPQRTPVADAFAAKAIKRWEPGEAELPRVSELSSYEEIDEDELDALYEAENAESYDGPSGGDKLGGWPDWIQDVEYPPCSTCEKPMQLVFQIDSTVNVDYMWGDSGCGHITQCPEHHDVLAFGWACM